MTRRILILAALVISTPALAVDGHGGAKWGQTTDEVKAVIPDLGECEGTFPNPALCREVEILGRKGLAAYQIAETGLTTVVLSFSDVTRDWTLEVTKLLLQKYGDPTKSEDTSVPSLGMVSVTHHWPSEGVKLYYFSSAETTLVNITYDRATMEAAKELEAAKEASLDAL